jgi:predicted N-acetyltransferase YhbS
MRNSRWLKVHLRLIDFLFIATLLSSPFERFHIFQGLPSIRNRTLMNSLDLAVLATDPEYEHQGAASMLLQWGIDRCIRQRVPAYLESTVEAAPLYERHGFKPEGSFTMTFPLKSKTDGLCVYSETCFLFRPPIGKRN